MDTNRLGRAHLALLVLLAGALPAAAQNKDEPQGLDVIPVQPLDEPAEEFAPLLPTVQWTFTGNIQGDTLAQSDLAEDRKKDTELRRARLSGVLEWYDWRMKLGVDLAEEAPINELSTPLRDFSFEYRGWAAHLEFGLFVEPFGMLQGGSRNSPLMERPQPAGLGAGYGVGFAVNTRGESWGFTGGIFGPMVNDVFFGGREEGAITLRGTLVPFRFEDGLGHIGLAVSQRAPVDSFLQFVTIPETVMLLGINTASETLIVDAFNLVGLELATQWGLVLVQGEYIAARISDGIVARDLFNGGEINTVSPTYDGNYVEAAWAITGERRDYSTRRGMFSGINSETPLFGGGIGAIELAARRSMTDLRDENGGGELGEVTSFGVNWYPIEYVKLMVTSLQIREESAAGVVEKTDATQVRVQLHYTLP